MEKKNREGTVCAACGGRMVHQAYEHIEKVGKYKVKDATAFALRCVNEKCGEVELSLAELAGYQRRAAAVVLREAPEVDGAVMKYARRALGMKQVDLAACIGCQPETLSRYETGTQVPRAVQLAVVAVLDGVEQAGGIEVYLEDKDGRASRTFEVPP